MKNTIVITTLCTLLCFTGILSCKKTTTTPPDPNEEELITTAKIAFTDSAGVQLPVEVVYKDLDGDGGNPPSQWDTIKLKPNTTYLAEIVLLNESGSPVDTISNEVWDERTEHLFCFTIQGLNCTVIRTDTDGTYEVGLSSKWKTALAGTGTAQVVLRHQPDVKDGSCSPGSTDLDITFPMKVE